MDINWNDQDDVEQPSQSSTILGEDKETDKEEFQRRLRSKQREESKRQRENHKLAREADVEGLVSRKHAGTDRRAQEKLAKRGFLRLQQVANNLDLKRLMQSVTQSAQCNCWGPEVASDKRAPHRAIYINYIESNPPEDAPRPLSKRFGVWLFYFEQHIHLAVAEQNAGEDDEQWQIAAVPAPDDCLLSLEYRDEDQESIKRQVEAAILSWQHMPD